MSHISRVGRRTWRARLAYACMYLALFAGTAGVAVPLLLLLGQSVTSTQDAYDFNIVPRYLSDEAALFRKYLAVKYHPHKLYILNAHYGTSHASYAQVAPPDTVNTALVNRWLTVRDTLPLIYKLVAFRNPFNSDVVGPAQRLYQRYVHDKYNGSMDAVNRAYGQQNSIFNWLLMPRTQLISTTHCMPDNAQTLDYRSFKAGLPSRYLRPIPVEHNWQRTLVEEFETADAFNRVCGTAVTSLQRTPLPERAPHNPAYRRVWETFVRFQCPPMFVRIDDAALPEYRNMLRKRYRGIKRYNVRHRTAHRSFSSVTWPRDVSLYGFALADWTEFRRIADVRHLSVRSPSGIFRKALLKKYGSVAGINREFGTRYALYGDIVPPHHQADWMELGEDIPGWRKHFFTVNYTEVWKALRTVGRALPVTGIYLLGLIITQAVVNTLCAYALSRFNLKYTYRMLAFFLATMAFPVEVTMIPDFLLLKQMNLLNTYWALFLPMAVNGYFIFVLKGFFDNIPQSLYEAAALDGLNEFSIFRKIALPLARPVLAWLVLQSFMLGYSQFLFSMVVCQERSMWTLMVWIYEMLSWSFPGMIAAAAVMAAIPGVIVFLIAQRAIVQGVVIPLDQ